MDLVTVSLDILLITLLVAALGYGVRLERRLKALRDGHAVFAQAVRELDQSVLRAEAGLDQLRKAGEEARDGLHDRILKAREAKTDLERLLARAERLRTAPLPVPVPEPAPAPIFRRQPPPQPAPYDLDDEDEAERVANAILSLGEMERVVEPRRQTPTPERLREPRRPEPAPPPRGARRASALDDDLFDTPTPDLRRALGGRR
jgi:hypothetical protein